MQFELHCRPFHIVGFNAHDLVPKAMINPWEYSTEGVCCLCPNAFLLAEERLTSVTSVKSILQLQCHCDPKKWQSLPKK